MKILCLHGFGSSGKILERQLSAITKQTDRNYEYVFVDGPVETHRGPGMTESVPGPFFSHTTGFSPHELAEAAEYIREQIYERGPFDGVLGFSQGAALLLAYLLQEQADGEDSGIRFAIFLSSTTPFSIDEACHISLLEGLTLDAIEDNALTDEQRIFVACTEHSFAAAKQIGVINPDYDGKVLANSDRLRTAEMIPRVLHPVLVAQRLRLPTVHVTGEKDFDFMQDMSNMTMGMCDPSLRKVLKHSGGHSVPVRSWEVQKMIAAMEWAVSQT